MHIDRRGAMLRPACPRRSQRDPLAGFRLTWEACLRIDWTRYPAWPVFLEAQGKVSALLEELVTVSAETKYVETK